MNKNMKQVGRDCQMDGCVQTVSDGPLWRVNPKGSPGVFMCRDHFEDMQEEFPRTWASL